jgi:predicted ferric reductase
VVTSHLPVHTPTQLQQRPIESASPAVGRTQRRPAPESGGRLLLLLLFWSGAATSIELWWLRVDSLTTTGDVFTAAGRVTGMTAGYVLLMQILLMSRVGWLERSIGAHDLTRWHRRLGAWLVFLVLAHVALTLVGYAALGSTGVVAQALVMFTEYEDLDKAFVAAAILTALGLLAIRGIRRALPYEAWYWLHLTAYVVLVLGYAHQFTHGQELAGGGFGRWYWIGLHALVIGSVLWGRLVHPCLFNVRHRLRVANVVPESASTVSIYITGRRLEGLEAQAGQHLRWRFLGHGCWWQTHPFSLSAAPNEEWLRVTVKAVGRYTAALQGIRPGTRVLAQRPAGHFTAARRVGRTALLIAAGSGIAPIRALLEDLPAGTVLIYRASHPGELVFRAELDHLAYQRDAQVWYVVGSRSDPRPRHVFTGRGLVQLVPDLRHRDIYLCGPPGLIGPIVRVLRRIGVPKQQIHLDPFEF